MTLLKRVLRSYLELGARAGWLAERALSFEQGRALHIMRMDYFPAQLRGMIGAEFLEHDLRELEAAHLQGRKETLAIAHTFSLRRDFPLQFAELKRTGRCWFRTEDLPLRHAYPGTYGYRLRAVLPTLTCNTSEVSLRGLLVNQGFSMLAEADGRRSPAVRMPEILPLAELGSASEKKVPVHKERTEQPFSGSGIDTIWELEFHAAANPYGLYALDDLELTFDVQARYSAELYEQQIQSMPKVIERMILVSANRYQPQRFLEIQECMGAVTLEFDLRAINLPAGEGGRKVKNLALLAVGGSPLRFSGSLAATVPITQAAVEFVEGVALSNLPPLGDGTPPLPPSPLNAFLDLPLDQLFRLKIDKGQNHNISFAELVDIVLAIEYSATIQ